MSATGEIKLFYFPRLASRASVQNPRKFFRDVRKKIQLGDAISGNLQPPPMTPKMVQLHTAFGLSLFDVDDCSPILRSMRSRSTV